MKTEISAEDSRGIHIVIIIAIFTYFLTGSNLFSQNIQSTASRQSSLEAFSKGDYEKAYSEFTELLKLYPKDALYKYYSGVCLVKLNRNPGLAVTLLTQAQQGAAAIRTIPADAVFWLGRASQLSGNFSEALESYNLFTEQAGKKVAREIGVPSFIQQCRENSGRIIEADKPTISTSEAKNPLHEQEEKKELPDKTGENYNKITSGSEVLSADYDKILSEALDYQYKSDSVYKIAEQQKQGIENLGYREKTELRSHISETENVAASFQKLADGKFAEAERKMNDSPFPSEKINEQKDTFPALLSDNKMKDTVFQSNVSIQSNVSAPKKDTMQVVGDNVKHNENIEKSGEMVPSDIPDQPVVQSQVKKTNAISQEVYSYFIVNKKAESSSGDKPEIDKEIPDGLIYRIQVAVFRNPVALSYFKGLGPVYGFKVPGTDKTNYFIGLFRRRADAAKALSEVRNKGFKDAFIVSLSGGKPVSAERAVLLEKEWGKKPLASVLIPATELQVDTIPPTLSFRVEVARAEKPVKDDILEAMKKIAGSRGLDTETLADGSLIYLIGNFITYESAGEFAGLLVRNGYRDAKVAAWLGRKEIPVETARQLFERLE